MVIVPIIFIIIVFIGVVKNIEVFDAFIIGAKDGVNTVFNIFPSLLGLIVAVSVFRSSGAMELIIKLIQPLAQLFNIPKELIPLAILRPISGSASLALVSDILKTYGVDSFVGKVACIIMGSTETILYTLSVYLGSIQIKNIRYTLIVAIIVEILGVCIAVNLAEHFFIK